MRSEVVFLGHVINSHGVTPNPENTEKVKNWPRPNSVKEVQSFLGLANYYRRFVQNYSEIARPLTKLTKKDEQFVWDDSCEEAFEHLKSALLSKAPSVHSVRLIRLT